MIKSIILKAAGAVAAGDGEITVVGGIQGKYLPRRDVQLLPSSSI
jgi:hypothetical protein